MPLRYDEIDEVKALIKEAIDAALVPKIAKVVPIPEPESEPEPIGVEPTVKKGKSK